MIEDRFTNTPEDAAEFERMREDFPPDRPAPCEYEDLADRVAEGVVADRERVDTYEGDA